MDSPDSFFDAHFGDLEHLHPEGWEGSVTFPWGDGLMVASDMDGDGVADHLTVVAPDGEAASWERESGALDSWYQLGKEPLIAPEEGRIEVVPPPGWYRI